jgi:ATP-dependent helicase/nuclease subunit B
MAVRILMGKARSGKTESCFAQIKAWTEQGGKAILIVPDQATYNMERRLAATMEGRGFMGTQIFGFTRLAFKVLQERGKEHTSLSELSRTIVLQRLLRNCQSQLSVLQQAAGQPNFAGPLGQMLAEFRSFQIAPDELRSAAAHMGDLTLSHKLHDVALLYEKYTDFLENHFGSADDTMTMLIKELPQYTFLQGAKVWIDGFQWFTPQQLAVLKTAERHCKTMTITVTMDGQDVAAQQRETALYHRPWEVYQALRKAFPHIETECLEHRSSEGLDRFTDAYFQRLPAHLSQPVSELIVTECVSPSAEIDGIARCIARLVQYGYRYRDFLILTRDSGNYDELAERIFRRYRIPCFTDYRRPMASHPVVEAISALLALVKSHGSHDTLFRLLKTDLFPLERRSVDELENYCLEHGISSRHWMSPKPWTYYRHRYIDDDKDTDGIIKEKLNHINAIRDVVRTHLLPFWEQAQGTHTIRKWCTLLYESLVSLGVPQTLRQWKQTDEESGRTAESKEHEQVWKKLISFLEEIVALCGDDEVDLDEFTYSMEDAFSTMTFSIIPPTLDHVTVTSIERGYTMQSRIVYICGLNDGQFPRHGGDEGLLNDEERDRLHDMGIVLGPGSRFRSLQEKFLFYLAVTRASERLYISYALADEQGKTLTPSLWLKQMKDNGYISEFRHLKDEISAASIRDFIVSMPAALSYLPLMLRPAVEKEPVAPIWWSLYDWAILNGYEEETKQIVKGLFYHNEAMTLTEPLVRALYAPAGQIIGSVTRFESYRQCPFAYFARYGLGLEERPVQSFSAPDLGTLVHEALRRIGDDLLQAGRQWSDIEKDDIPTLCTAVVDDLSPKIQNDILVSNAYFVQIKGRLIQVLIRTVDRLRQFKSVSSFRTFAVEQGFGRHASLWQPLQFRLYNGIEVIVTGQIDRIDTYQKGACNYIVVMDYKSGGTQLDLEKIYAGLQLQLLTYMKVALKELGHDAVPAAVLYCYVRNRKVSERHVLTQEEKNAIYEQENKVRGFFLDDPSLMTQLDGTLPDGSRFVTIKLKKDGEISKAQHNVFGQSWWNKAMGVTEKRIHEIANQMGNGDISIAPVMFKTMAPCTYCQYQSVCAFDPKTGDGTYRYVQRLTKDEIIERIDEEGGEDYGVD